MTIRLKGLHSFFSGLMNGEPLERVLSREVMQTALYFEKI